MSNSNVLARLTRGATRVARRMRHQKHSPRLGRELFDQPLKPRCRSGLTTLGEPEQFVVMATAAMGTYCSFRGSARLCSRAPQTRARRSIGRHRPSDAPALSSRSKRLSANLRVQKKARHHQRNGGVRVPRQLGSPCWGTRYLALIHLREFRDASAARRLLKRSAEVRYLGTQRVRRAIRDSSAHPNVELRPGTLAA
jgi:hypothetical protein